jgi:hypothetical protein
LWSKRKKKGRQISWILYFLIKDEGDDEEKARLAIEEVLSDSLRHIL